MTAIELLYTYFVITESGNLDLIHANSRGEAEDEFHHRGHSTTTSVMLNERDARALLISIVRVMFEEPK